MKTVLIVDDSDFMRTLIKKYLAELDVSVVGEANDGNIAVEKYKELSPDIVTLDIAMLEHNGLDALKEIMQINPDAKVVVVSSTADMASVVDEALALGALAVLNKPINKGMLVGIIGGILNE